MSAFSFGRKNKYRATRTADGFASKLEKAVFMKLKERETLGLIRDIKRQQTVVLQEGGKDVRIAWKIDFSFEEFVAETFEWRKVYCEAKGLPTNDFLLKLKLYRATQSAPLEIWKGDYRRPRLVERIEK